MKKLTKTEFRELIPQVVGKFTPKKRKITKNRIYKDFWFFFRNYLPHYRSEKNPEFHQEIIKLLESDAKKIAIAAPRGFSKSTLVSFAFVLWVCLTSKYKFIVILSASDDLAEDLSSFIRAECRDNHKLIADFKINISEVGSKGDFVVNRTRILARGKNQAVRGFRFREHRPDLIILDDIEKDLESLSPKQIRKTLDLITRALIPSLKPKGKIVFLGTVLRKKSVAGTLLFSEEEPWIYWKRKIYSALNYDENGQEKSLWEERFPVKFLLEQKKTMGTLAFNSEYQNQALDDEGSFFQESMFQVKNLEAKELILFIDPSVDGIKNNDYKSAVLLGRNGSDFEIREGIMQQGSDLPFFEKLVNLYQRFQEKILKVCMESNGFQVYYLRELEKFALEKGVHLRISGVKHFHKKELRILKLLPLFERGKIYFHSEFYPKKEAKILMEQLLYFPHSSVHDDAPDALAGAVEAFDKINSVRTNYTVVPKSPFESLRIRKGKR